MCVCCFQCIFGLRGILFVHSVGDLQCLLGLRVCAELRVSVCVPLCCWISVESSIYIRLHLLEVFAHRLSVTVIVVARLGNQILFIASRLFQHIRIMINREMGVV